MSERERWTAPLFKYINTIDRLIIITNASLQYKELLITTTLTNWAVTLEASCIIDTDTTVLTGMTGTFIYVILTVYTVES